MSAHETFDPDTYIVIGCVFPVGDVDQLSQAYVLERLESFYLPQPGISKSPTRRYSRNIKRQCLAFLLSITGSVW